MKKGDKFRDPLDSNEPFEIPKRYLDQLSEFTCGGYMLWYINNFGQIVFKNSFDSETSFSALCAKATRTLTSINNCEQAKDMQNFLNGPDDSDEGPCDDPGCKFCHPDD